jgi:hypothetical protein
MNGSPVNSEEAINRPLLSDTDIVWSIIKNKCI